MATNLFDKIISLASSALSGPTYSDDYPIYKTETDGLTGVARYLQKQEEANPSNQALTGVEKYLAKQAAQEVSIVPPETAVAKTGVAKYLANQPERPKAAAPAKKSVKKKPATGVDKYLTEPKPAKKAAAKPKPKAKPAAKKAPTKKAAVAPAKKPAAASQKSSTSASTGMIKLSEGAKQCQGITSKKTQCRRTTPLTTIQRTINKQKYQFAVCNQHNSESFKPFQALLKK